MNPLAEGVSSIFSVSHLNDRAKDLLLRYLVYSSLVRSMIILSSTFLILYVLDAVGFAAAGALVGIRLFVQAVFDYPTGILSDWIGQKYVLVLSYVSFGISFFLFSFSDTYSVLLVAYIFYAFATAQESGTLTSWFDNNYRFVTGEDDPDRSSYRSILGKFRTIVDLFGAIMLIVGGWLATSYSRQLVFQIQVVAMVVLVLATFRLIYDFEGLAEVKDTGQNYVELLKEGVTSILQSKLLLLMVSASVLYQIGAGVFGNLIMFPIYFGYTGTDLGASIFRFTLFILGSLALWLVADYIGTLAAKKWMPRFHLIHALVFYGGILLLFWTTPITNSLNWQGAILAGLVIFVGHMFRVAISIFLRRIYLDVIPDHRRNGFYSFEPTLVLLFQSPFVLGSGQVIEFYGFTQIVMVLGLISLVSTAIFYWAVQHLDEEVL